MATIRLDDAVNERMKSAAAKAGISTTKLIEQACVQYLDGPPRPTPGQPASPRRVPAGAVSEDDCPHPKLRHRIFSWGKICGDCGKLNP